MSVAVLPKNELSEASLLAAMAHQTEPAGDMT
jgi:hypothetical protein